MGDYSGTPVLACIYEKQKRGRIAWDKTVSYPFDRQRVWGGMFAHVRWESLAVQVAPPWEEK